MEKNLTNFGLNNRVFVSTTRFASDHFLGSILKYIYERLIQRKICLLDKIKRYFLTHEEASSLCMNL